MSKSDLAALLADMKKARKRYPKAVKKQLKKTGEAILKEAKGLYGQYQDGWPQLAEATQERRTKLGYSPDDPLLMTGQLRDAQKAEVAEDGKSVFVGAPEGATLTSPTGKSVPAALVQAVHEDGTVDGRVPARPVYGIVEHRIEKHQAAFVEGVAKELGL